MAEETVSAATSVDDDELERLYQSVMTCKPRIAAADVDEFETKIHNDIHWRRARRCGLNVASQDGSFFKRLSEDEDMARTFAETLGPIEDQAKLLREIADTIEAGRMRMVIALCNYKWFDPRTDTCEEASHG